MIKVEHLCKSFDGKQVLKDIKASWHGKATAIRFLTQSARN